MPTHHPCFLRACFVGSPLQRLPHVSCMWRVSAQRMLIATAAAEHSMSTRWSGMHLLVGAVCACCGGDPDSGLLSPGLESGKHRTTDQARQTAGHGSLGRSASDTQSRIDDESSRRD